MKRTIRLRESDLHRIIKESVKRFLRESKQRRKLIRESLSFDEYQCEILAQYGLNPQLVSKLNSPSEIPVYNSDKYLEDNPYDLTSDFGIEVDPDDDNISIHINAEQYREDEDRIVADMIKGMCDELQQGFSPEDVWSNLSYNWSL